MRVAAPPRRFDELVAAAFEPSSPDDSSAVPSQTCGG
jgi:hypothetical protein